VKFKIDENLPVDLVADLHLAGHDTDTVLDENLAGAADSVVVAAALQEGRILLTLDKGISSRSFRPLGGAGFHKIASGRPSHPGAGESRDRCFGTTNSCPMTGRSQNSQNLYFVLNQDFRALLGT
jgi:Domain of unknown function (DUF5615)